MSQKNSRMGCMAGAGSGQQERMQVRPMSVGAYEYGKCNGGVSLVDKPLRPTATTPKPARLQHRRGRPTP